MMLANLNSRFWIELFNTASGGTFIWALSNSMGSSLLRYVAMAPGKITC